MAVQKGRLSNEMKLLRFRQRSKRGFRSQIALTLPAGKAKAGQSIATIFSQFGIDANKFCQDFNNKTKDYIIDIPVPITISVTWEKTYTYRFRELPMIYVIGLLWFYNMFFDRKYISTITMWQLLVIYEQHGLIFGDLLGTFRSMDLHLTFISYTQYIDIISKFYV